MKLSWLPVGTGKVLTGTVLGQGILIVASPILTRLFDPSEFGLFALWLSIVSVVAITATLRLDALLPVPRSDQDAFVLLVLSFAWILVVSLTSALAALFLRSLWPDQSYSATWFASLTAFGIFAVACYELTSGWLVRQNAHGALGARAIAQGAGQASTQVGAGVLDFGAAGLMLGVPLGRVAGIIYNTSAMRLPKPPWRSWKKRAGRLWQEHRSFPLHGGVGAFLNTTSLQTPVLMLGLLHGAVAAGLYALMVRVLGAPVTVMGQAVSRSYQVAAGNSIRNGEASLLASYKITSRSLAFMAALPCLTLLVLAPPLFSTIFGEEWRSAGVAAQLMVPAMFVQFVVSPVSRVLLLLGKSKTQSQIEAVKLVAVIVLPLGLSPLGFLASIVGVSIAQCVGYAWMYWACKAACAQHDRAATK